MLGFQSLFLVVALAIAPTVLVIVEGKSVSVPNNHQRVARDVDGLPAEEDAHTLETIRHDLTQIRNAESRLNKFIEGIQSGFETGRGVVNTTFSQFMDRVGRGTSEIQKTFESFRDNTPKSFPELVERISGDTHVLLETLHRRLDALGNNIKVLLHDEESAEERPKSTFRIEASPSTSTDKPKDVDDDA